jgi:hypothetical protein
VIPDDKRCDLDPNRISENRNREGEVSQEKSPSRFCACRKWMRIRAPLVVEGEWNVVLSPKHPQFALVQIADPKPFRYDERMFR